ncbi:hypothetical protein [Gloeothece verrucosa]|uniref:TIGR04255 family protein n=1 Tax=Gloeothece verrucosa (strain PCC 7822) TaxID=497965 RepID=E0ULQ4_GLOV7|nr:hypothetical protein [Gloeothece verrucosa]ADN17884.1 conserved hypothetical protein [Gloeothece verrucosa PCC 7822]
MTQSLTTQELVIVVAVKNNNPTILNADFLKYSGVVPAEWELARPPVYTNQVVQIIFQNGISIAAQADRIMFLEAIGTKNLNTLEVAEVAYKYIEALPRAEYQAVGINLRSYVGYENDADGAYQYICNKLLSAGKWQNYGDTPAKASINYFYNLENRQLSLSVNEATLQFPEQVTLPVVLFSGNFSYDLGESEPKERLKNIGEIIANWKEDLNTYTNLINEGFLAHLEVNTSEAADLFPRSSSF